MIRTFGLLLVIILTLSCRNNKSSDLSSPSTENQSLTEATNDTINDLLKITHPTEGQLITSPLEVTGEARGYWFFEATAPVELLDGNMDQISEKYITATGDWMTEDWVQFSGTITFDDPSTESGYLIFHKANPSGLQEHAMRDTIEIKFK